MTAPRLFVLTASASAGAVILRRGPSKMTAALYWDRESDVIEMGQWVKARIYEHRSDLSPDGRHMIYFANKGGGVGGYTVISRAPWFRALYFSPQGHTWHGGGAFSENGSVFLNGATPETALPDGLAPTEIDAFPHSTDGFHMGDLFAAIMLRRGWHRSAAGGYALILTRVLENGVALELSVVQGRKDRGLISCAFALVGGDGQRYDMPDWTWADRWGDGLHFARAGALWFGRTTEGCELVDTRLIRDFGDMTYREIRAPYEGIRE